MTSVRVLSPRALFIPLAISIGLHLALLIAIGPRTHPPTAAPAKALFSRLGIVVPTPAARAQPLPVAAEVQPRTVSPDKPMASSPVAAQPAPIAAQQRPAPISIPHDIVEPEPAADGRVRTVIIATPATYGISEQYASPGGTLPYAWSSAFDTPPQTRSTREASFPGGEHPNGLVLVRALLGTPGTIDEVSVLCGDEPFLTASAQALAGWSFKTATSGGVPVRTWVLLEFAFIADNLASDFDPVKADQSLGAMREKCALRLAASR